MRAKLGGFIALLAVGGICCATGLYYHDMKIDRAAEIAFFGVGYAAVAAALCWLFYEAIQRNVPH